MKFGGIGIPELLIGGFILLLVLAGIAIAIVAVTRNSRNSHMPPPPINQTPVPPPTSSDYTKLTELDSLCKQGVISESEFEQKKAEILARM